jgi:hypothetical protein
MVIKVENILTLGWKIPYYVSVKTSMKESSQYDFRETGGLFEQFAWRRIRSRWIPFEDDWAPRFLELWSVWALEEEFGVSEMGERISAYHGGRFGELPCSTSWTHDWKAHWTGHIEAAEAGPLF